MMCTVEQSLVCLEDSEVVSECTHWPADDVLHDVTDDAGRGACRRAMQCRTLLDDDRVLANLLETEHNCRPSDDCFCTRQTEVLPYMRDTVVTWMLEVRFTTIT